MNKTYIAKLKADSEAVNLRREQEKLSKQAADKLIVCDIPLMEQIEALMRTLPPALRDRPWTMEEFTARLSGRYKARPHPMHVGAALRQLGFEQMRDWSREGGGRRVWILTG